MLDAIMMAALLGSIGLVGLLIYWCGNQVDSEQ